MFNECYSLKLRKLRKNKMVAKAESCETLYKAIFYDCNCKPRISTKLFECD